MIAELFLDGGGVPVFVGGGAVVGGSEGAAADRGNVIDFLEHADALELEHAGGGEIGGAGTTTADGDADEIAGLVGLSGGEIHGSAGVVVNAGF